MAMIRTPSILVVFSLAAVVLGWRLLLTPEDPSAAAPPRLGDFTGPFEPPAADRDSGPVAGMEAVPFAAPGPEVGSPGVSAAPEGSMAGSEPPAAGPPAGGIAVLARDSAGPAPRGTAWILPVAEDGLPEDAEWTRRPSARGRALDADGAAVHAGLPEATYVVGLELEGRLVREARVRVTPGRGTVQVVFALGDARIEGRVLDAQGAPVAGAPVRLDSIPRAGRPATFAWTAASAEGRFAFSRLPAGAGVLSAGWPSRWDQGGRCVRRVELEAGVAVELDLAPSGHLAADR